MPISQQTRTGVPGQDLRLRPGVGPQLPRLPGRFEDAGDDVAGGERGVHGARGGQHFPVRRLAPLRQEVRRLEPRSHHVSWFGCFDILF